ncbi:MAG TPA: hypothetical protein VN677_01900 [Gemmatimonadaceae bacterium]|nr:hypothetical protein [Gemmatimonadaceae bacterium]
MPGPTNPRRALMGAAKRLLMKQADAQLRAPAPLEPPRLILQALEKIDMSRSRDRILANLDEMYREAFDRAKNTGDDSQMATLDFAYRREQLYFEILLDIRDGMTRG